MKRQTTLLVILAAIVLFMSCVTARRRMTVTIVTAHSILSEIQDTERTMVCGHEKAPLVCIDQWRHREISAQLATAFELETDVAKVVRALPAASPSTPQINDMMFRLNGLVSHILGLIPQSEQKTVLLQKIGAR